MAEKILQKFRQRQFRGEWVYVAREIHYVELADKRVKTVIVLENGKKEDYITVERKFYEMNLNGFDVESTDKFKRNRKTHHTGMLEDTVSWEAF